MLSSLSIDGADVSGGFDGDRPRMEHSGRIFDDYVEKMKVPNLLVPYPSRPAELPSALTSLDVCCPSLCSFSLRRCPGVQSLIIQQRSPPASLATADGEAYGAAMASVLEEIEILHCEGLSQLVLRSTPASSVNASPKAPSFFKKQKTIATRTAHPPRHSAIVDWNVEECGRLRTIEVESGWVLGRKTKRSLTYFALQHPEIKVSAKGIGQTKAI